MSSIDNISFINAQNLSAATTSDSQTTSLGDVDHVAVLKLANTSGATVGGVIEHSFDKVTWATLHTFGGLSADGLESGEVTAIVGPHVRADLTVSGGTADVTCQLWFDKRAR